MAGLGQRGAPLLNGSVDKLIDFISVSHITPNPYWSDGHWSHVHCSEDYALSISCLSPVFFSFSFFFFLSHHISCVSGVSLFCSVLSTISLVLYRPPLLLLLFTPSLFLPLFGGSVLNLASMPVSKLALPLWEAGGQAEETMFSRSFLWMKRWNKGMKALGKVWKLPIHQCKEILR